MKQRLIKMNSKQHYRLYKRGKLWVVAGVSTLALGGLFLGAAPVAAATPANASTSQTVTATAQSAASSAASASSSAVSASADNAASSAVANDSAATVASSAADASTTSQASSAAMATSAAAISSAASQVTSAAASSTAPTNSTADATSSAVNSSAAVTASSAATVATSTADSSAVTSAATSASTIKQSTVASSAVSPQASSASATTVTALGAATQAEITAAKTQAAAVYQATGQPQQVTAASGEPVSTATATMTSSATNIGYGSNLRQFTLTLTMNNVKAGDVITYTLPTGYVKTFINGTIGLDKIQDFGSEAEGVMTTSTAADGSITVTDTFNQDSAQTIQVVNLNLADNYGGQVILQGEEYTDQKLLTVGAYTYTVDVYVNGVKQEGGAATFTQTITPTVDVTAPTQLYPDTDVAGLLPNTTYVWSVPVNESNGVYDIWYRANRVNQLVNYGTTITIPTPAGFVLDQNLTNTLNAFGKDKTTITQPGGVGGDIIITVPKGSGSQYYYNDPAYRIAGQIEATQAATDTTLTAAGVITMVQKTNDAGDTATYTSKDAWTATILGTDSTQDVSLKPAALGNSNADSTKLNQDPSKNPATLLQFKYAYHAAAATKNATITLTVPDGLTINKIEVPAGGVTRAYYMPDTTSYGYTLTLADGTTETGTVAAGGTVTSNGVIRTAVFTPDYLAPGATSDLFKLSGTLATTYDDGTAVAVGDQLTSRIDLTVDGGASGTSSSFIQTIVNPTIATVNVADNGTHRELAPGKGQGSVFEILGDSAALGQLYEPIVYFVVPNAFVIDSVTNPQNANITRSTDDNGDTVVKVDFTGTGESVDLMNNQLGLKLHNATDAMVGSYKLEAYVTSPTTGLNKTDKVTVTDTSKTMGDTQAMLAGDLTWQIDTVSNVNAYTLAQGDDLSASTAATIDKNSTNSLNFYDTVMNIGGTALSDVTSIVNLPEVGDIQGSTYTYQLTGPITLPDSLTTTTGTTVPLTGATVLYSTDAADLKRDTPDLTNYMTADQVKDWTTIHSVAITFANLPANTTTGRITLAGTTTDMQNQAGKIGYIGTAFYNSGELTTNQAVSIAITGTSTILARAHYTDASGADHYIDFTDLNRTLTDNADSLTNDYPQTQADLSAADVALLPAGYALRDNSLQLIDSQGNVVNGFGQVVTDALDGVYAQYELDATNQTVNVQYVDDVENGAQVGDLTPLTGQIGTSQTWTANVPAGYVLAKDQAASGTVTFAATNPDVVIHLVHAITSGTATTTRTITYTGAGAQTPVAKVQTANWVTSTDQITGKTVATAQNGYDEVLTPTIAGYTPDQTSVGDVDLGAATVADLQDIDVTVTYSADKQTVNVKYVDDDNSGVQVGETEPLNGTTDATASWTATVPTGYVLAKDQAASGTATFAATNPDVVIHLVHAITRGTATTTRTITYKGAGAQTPVAKEQTANWVTSTDQVTGQTVATAQNGYDEVLTPPIVGYTPDLTSVAAVQVSDLKELTNTTATVTYKANDQTVNVKYVDDDNNGAQVGEVEPLNGTTDATANWTATVPTGYTLAKDQAASGTVTFAATNNPDVVIHLQHIITHGTATTTRTITYTGTNQNPEPVVQTANWLTTTDQATGIILATDQTGYDEALSPTIAGYTPDQASVTNVGLGSVQISNLEDLKNTDVTVTYSADEQTANVKYVDDDNGGTQVGKTETLSGETDTTANWTATVPAGYELATGQATSGTVTFAATNNPDVVIHLQHVITYGTATTTRTITYTGAGAQNPAAKVQTANWLTSTDQVTGTILATDQTGYDEVTTPEIAGYTPDQASVTNVGLGSVQISNLEELKNTDVTVTYSANDQSVNVKYVDDDNNGAQVGKTTTLNGETDTTADWTATIPTGYALAKDQATSGTVTFAATNPDVEIHLQHVITHGTATTTRTITYTGAGDLTPKSVAQTATWLTTTDQATGIILATDQTGYAEVKTPTIFGYTPDKASVAHVDLSAVQISDLTELQNTNVTVTYQAVPLTADESQQSTKLIVRGVTADGQQIYQADPQSGVQGTTFTVNAPAIGGYQLVAGSAPSVSGTYRGNQMTVTFTYEHGVVPEETGDSTLTVHYVDTDGHSIKPDMVQSGTKGTGFAFNAPVISGYLLTNPSLAHVTGTYQGNGMVLTLTYEKVLITPPDQGGTTDPTGPDTNQGGTTNPTGPDTNPDGTETSTGTNLTTPTSTTAGADNSATPVTTNTSTTAPVTATTAVIGTSAATALTTKPMVAQSGMQQATLPQTGDQANQNTAWLGAMLLSMGALLGVVPKRSKRH